MVHLGGDGIALMVPDVIVVMMVGVVICITALLLLPPMAWVHVEDEMEEEQGVPAAPAAAITTLLVAATHQSHVVPVVHLLDPIILILDGDQLNAHVQGQDPMGVKDVVV